MSSLWLVAVSSGLISLASATAYAAPEDVASRPASAVGTETASPAKTTQIDGDREFTPPAQYQKRLRDGKEVFCRQIVPAGSRIKRTECFTKAQVEAIEEAQRAFKDDMRRQGVICADERCKGG